MARDRKEGKPRNSGSHVHGWTAGRCRTCRARCAGCGLCACEVDAVYGAAVRANYAAAQIVHEGKAFGGPRDGVKLKASARWDGTVAGYEGHYTWEGSGWQWVPARSALRTRRDGRRR